MVELHIDALLLGFISCFICSGGGIGLQLLRVCVCKCSNALIVCAYICHCVTMHLMISLLLFWVCFSFVLCFFYPCESVRTLLCGRPVAERVCSW